MDILDVVFGRPLASKEARAEQIGAAAGIPIFGLDALSSAAYGPEAALTLLIPLGAAGVAYILPISASIILLLTIVYFSYRQTIAAYPSGGGSYTVARENLGEGAGLLAASALLIDYVLNVAVGISAGVGALVSAAPSLQKHTLSMCLLILLMITLVNLRGVREAGLFFMVPTYLFVICLVIMIVMGLAKLWTSGGHPVPIVAAPVMPAATTMVSLWLLLKVFASGCAAMTGVEAVSNGVSAFREPTTRNAQRALTMIIVLLVVLLAGIAYLAKSFGIGATDPNGPGYQSVLSMLLLAVVGKGVFYYVSIGSILLVLCLSANTSFADFPRLCRVIALDGYLPHGFSLPGRRLVFEQGIYVLAALSAGLLIVFGGITDRLIPLFAVGAFLAFTMSQTGMVWHWKKQKKISWHSILVNGLGAIATGLTVIVVLVAKFVEGAWITMLLIPAILAVMVAVHRHYQTVSREIASTTPADLTDLQPPIVVLPVHQWNRVTRAAVRLAYSISHDVHGLCVDAGESGTDQIEKDWNTYAQEPARAAGLPPPPLEIISSPYRRVFRPILDYVLQMECDHPGRPIAVVVPELVEAHWYHHLMHNKRANILKAWLLVRGSKRIIVINVPWYLDS